MEQTPRGFSWEAPEHNHTEKGGDWFFAFTIIFIAIVLSAVLLGNTLFALLMALSGVVLAIAAAKRPAIITYGVSVRGVRIAEEMYPFATLISYCIDEEDPKGPQLLIKSSQKFVPLIVVPLPENHLDDIEDILKDRLPEEHLEEPLIVKILEIFGF